MIKQIFLPLIAVAFFVVLVGLLSKNPAVLNKYLAVSTPTSSGATDQSVTISGKTIEVELANTPSSRSKGLSNRDSLDDNKGMLFVFDSKKVSPGFWMKDMRFSIDIIWIRDGVVDKIDKEVVPPAAKTPDSKLKVYNPQRPIDYVLEVNSGFSDKNGIKVGDNVTLPNL